MLSATSLYRKRDSPESSRTFHNIPSYWHQRSCAPKILCSVHCRTAVRICAVRIKDFLRLLPPQGSSAHLRSAFAQRAPNILRTASFLTSQQHAFAHVHQRFCALASPTGQQRAFGQCASKVLCVLPPSPRVSPPPGSCPLRIVLEASGHHQNGYAAETELPDRKWMCFG